MNIINKMDEIYKKITTEVYGWLMTTTHKKLDITILSSGVAGTLSDWFLDNFISLLYFIVFGIAVTGMKLVKFREEMRHLKRLNDLVYKERVATLNHKLEQLKKEENDNNSQQ